MALGQQRAATVRGRTAGGRDRRASTSKRVAARPPDDTLLRPPTLRPGTVPRPDLIRSLCGPDAPSIVVLSAPAGYGKTTLLVQWAKSDPRPFAWVSITPALQDPAVLLAHLGEALDAVASIDGGGLTAEPRFPTAARSQPVHALRLDGRGPFVLVLDDAHLLHGPGWKEVLAGLAAHLPGGSGLAIAGRRDPPLSLSRLQATGQLRCLGVPELALTPPEGQALLHAAGCEADPAAESTLIGRADGWAAGLYLATLAIRDDPDRSGAADRFTGDDRLVGDYLRDEVLQPLPRDLVRFLVETSAVDTVCGGLCDAMLDRSGSARRLEQVARSNLFLMPLDRTGDSYRYHPLLHDLLRSELRRRGPLRERELHARASEWYETHGEIDQAIRHAALTGDTVRCAGLVWCNLLAFVGAGRSDVVAGWLELFSDRQIAGDPQLALAAAWCSVASADSSGSEYWTDVASRSDPGQRLAEGTPVGAVVSLLRAAVGKGGLPQVLQDAAASFAADRVASPYRAVSQYLEGAALRLLGWPREARVCLEEAARSAAHVAPAIAALCHAHLALIDLDDGNWEDAALRGEQTRRLSQEYRLGFQPGCCLASAISALLFAHGGARAEAQLEIEQTQRLLGCSPVGAWMVVQTRLVLVHAALAIGDVGAARRSLREATVLARAAPELGTLTERLRDARKMLASADPPGGGVAAPLTAAELRILRYLPTHLTVGAIADELFISRNTAKSHSIAVYRKLGVSSRGAAVAQARELGLLED